MRELNREQRQSIGCGYEPAIPTATPWQPPAGPVGYKHDELTVCAGFLTKLPVVQEAARAHVWWSKSQLQLLHADPSELLKQGIEEIECENSRARLYWITPRKEGGGRGD